MESNQFNQFAETGQYSLTEGSISSATVDVFVAKNITENDVPSTLPHVLTAEAITETNVEEATAIHNNDDENDTDSEEDEMSDVDSDLEDVLRDWEFQLADREADRALDFHWEIHHGLAEEGPSTNFALYPIPRDHHLQQLFRSTPAEIQVKIMSHVLAPGPRRIRAIWSHAKKDWTYRSEQYNQIPFVIHAMGGTMKVEAQKYLKPAPALSERLNPYPYFNYRKDTLVLDYLRCGNTPKYINQYIEAIDAAATQLELSQDRPGEHTLKHLEVSFCCQVRDFAAIIDPFLNLNLDKLILVLHNHDKVFDYDHDYEKWARLTHRDSNWVWRKLNRGAHLGYPFEVELWNAKGFRMDDDFLLIEDMPSDEEYDSEYMNEHPWIDEPPTESEEEDDDDEESG